IEPAFLTACKEEITRADYSFKNGNYVQIIDQKHFDRLVALLDHDKVYHGGKVDRAERYIEPTILSDVTFEHPSKKQEIFGPLLPVVRYKDLDSALSAVCDRPRPLACYIFSASTRVQQQV